MHVGGYSREGSAVSTKQESHVTYEVQTPASAVIFWDTSNALPTRRWESQALNFNALLKIGIDIQKKRSSPRCKRLTSIPRHSPCREAGRKGELKSLDRGPPHRLPRWRRR